jgi:hypothetical protein
MFQSSASRGPVIISMSSCGFIATASALECCRDLTTTQDSTELCWGRRGLHTTLNSRRSAATPQAELLRRTICWFSIVQTLSSGAPRSRECETPDLLQSPRSIRIGTRTECRSKIRTAIGSSYKTRLGTVEPFWPMPLKNPFFRSSRCDVARDEIAPRKMRSSATATNVRRRLRSMLLYMSDLHR